MLLTGVRIQAGKSGALDEILEPSSLVITVLSRYVYLGQCFSSGVSAEENKGRGECMASYAFKKVDFYIPVHGCLESLIKQICEN